MFLTTDINNIAIIDFIMVKKKSAKKKSKPSIPRKEIIKIAKATLLDITKLKPNPRNVKEHTDAQIHDIMQLMKMAKFKDPIVIDKKNVIWAGHGRLLAAKKLGLKKVPVIYLEGLNEDQKNLFLLMDNKVNESPWIAENVKFVFDNINPMEFSKFEMTFDDYFQLDPGGDEDDWKGMPEFLQESEESYQRIIMNFIKKEDVSKFAALIKQSISPRTRSMWYPPQKLKKKKDQWEDE